MTIKARTQAYRKDELPQTSPSRSGPMTKTSIADMPVEWQAWLQSLKPPKKADGTEYKRSMGGFRKVR